MKKYFSLDVAGNLHDIARYTNRLISEDETIELVAVDSSSGSCVVIYSRVVDNSENGRQQNL